MISGYDYDYDYEYVCTYVCMYVCMYVPSIFFALVFDWGRHS